MNLPKEFWLLPRIDYYVLATSCIQEKGLFWLDEKSIGDKVRRFLEEVYPDAHLHLLQYEPHFEYALIDSNFHPVFLGWLPRLAQKRADLRSQGVAEHLLPIDPD